MRPAPSPLSPDFRDRLWRIIFLSDTPAGKAFDVVLLWLIAASVTVVMLESMPNIRAENDRALRLAEYGFTAIFTLEYLTRIYVSRRPLRYMLSFFGIVDLLSILPTYIHLAVPAWEGHHLAVIRVLRLLRMFRVLKMVRHMGESRVLINALLASRPKISVFLLGVLTLVTIMGTLIHVVEGPHNPGFDSIPKSIYWAIVTITTVGYGDITPRTPLGQFISSVMMIIGYAIIAVPTGIVGAELTMSSNLDRRECASCGLGGHLINAKFCRECGEKLEPEANVPSRLEGQDAPRP